MPFKLRRLIFSITYNTFLFIILLIGIQNSSEKNQVNFLFTKTINLPTSFIIGVSFISGSMLGTLIAGD